MEEVPKIKRRALIPRAQKPMPSTVFMTKIRDVMHTTRQSVWAEDAPDHDTIKLTGKNRLKNAEHLKCFLKAYIFGGFCAKSASLAIGDPPYYAESAAYKYLDTPFIKKELDKWHRKMDKKIMVDLNYKIQKLKKIIDICVPDDATEKRHIFTKGALAAIAELNKMQGDYAPTRTVNANLEGSDEINKYKEFEESILKIEEERHRKDY